MVLYLVWLDLAEYTSLQVMHSKQESRAIVIARTGTDGKVLAE